MAIIFGGLLSLFNLATTGPFPGRPASRQADAWRQVLAVGRLHKSASTGDTLGLAVLKSGQGQVGLALSYSFE